MITAADPSGDLHKYEQENEQENPSAEECISVRLSFPNRLAAAFVFAADRFQDRLNPDRDAAFEIIRAKSRFDLSFRDVERSRVGQRAFESVADLNVHLAILREDEEHDAVAFVRLSDAPRLRDALRVSRDVVIALHLRINRDYDLVRSFALELRELFVETICRALRNGRGVIVKVSGRFRRNRFARVRA